ncbi:MAG TPA: response regulator, partial [Bacteroidetes bacterium]|nr:response regulator [Bacteroidota bacterium]
MATKGTALGTTGTGKAAGQKPEYSPDQETAKILVVEDRPEHAEYIKFLLENRGFTVLSASRERQVLQLLKQGDVDLVLLDLLLEGKSGLSICQRIRNEEHFDSIPILILTSRTNIEDKISGFQAGADDYLTKPFKAQELLARIELLLQKKRLKESEDRYRSFVENLDDLVFMLDPGGTIQQVNRKAAGYLGGEGKKGPGASFFRFVAPDYGKIAREVLKQISQGEKVKNIYIRLKFGKKREIPFELTGFGLFRGGKLLQIQLVLRDISHREELQREIKRYMDMLEK